VQTANSSHWKYISRGANYQGSRRLIKGTVRESLKLMKNLKNQAKIQTDSPTQKVTQGILRTQRFTNQEKKATRANGHKKFKKPKRQRDSSPVESPILFKDKFVSADTDQSPQIHLDLEQNVTEYYSFPRSKVLNGLREKDGVHTL
jgi:hypothetical protein